MSDHATVLAAYLGNNPVPPEEIGAVSNAIRAALNGEAEVETSVPGIPARELSAKEIRDSIKPAGLVCFEDGKTYKTMRRALARLGLTPETYRAKWGLPPDYPMVCADYSAARSELAKTMGLGKQKA